MAGETALSANSTTGVYLLIDNNGWVAANLPGQCNLGGDSGLVLASGYIYFDNFLSLSISASTPRNDSFTGWNLIQNGETTLAKGQGNAGVLRTIMLSVLVDSTTQANWSKFFDVHQANTEYQAYLVRQWASTTFRQWDLNETLKSYTPILPVGFQNAETNKEGKDVQTLIISLLAATRSLTP